MSTKAKMWSACVPSQTQQRRFKAYVPVRAPLWKVHLCLHYAFTINTLHPIPTDGTNSCEPGTNSCDVQLHHLGWVISGDSLIPLCARGHGYHGRHLLQVQNTPQRTFMRQHLVTLWWTMQCSWQANQRHCLRLWLLGSVWAMFPTPTHANRSSIKQCPALQTNSGWATIPLRLNCAHQVPPNHNFVLPTNNHSIRPCCGGHNASNNTCKGPMPQKRMAVRDCDKDVMCADCNPGQCVRRVVGDPRAHSTAVLPCQPPSVGCWSMLCCAVLCWVGLQCVALCRLMLSCSVV